MSILNFYFVSLVGILTTTDAARILAYFPSPSISHQVVFRPIILILVERGHEVTFITTDPMFSKGDAPTNLNEIDLHDMSYGLVTNNVVKAMTSEIDLLSQINLVKEFSVAFLEKQLEVPEIKSLLQNRMEKFDLIMLEGMFTPALGLIHIFDAPTILVSSFGMFPNDNHIVGAPNHPIIYHNVFNQKHFNLTSWDKIREVYYYVRISHTLSTKEEKENKVLKKLFGPDCPPLEELRKKIDMLFLNINPIWEGNHPVPPNVVHMGGLHLKPYKELPKDLQSYLDASKNGVIYFSFGSNVRPSLLPPEVISIFERVLSKLPYDVLWKWDKESYQPKSKNVKVFKWLPQSDLLRHPNIKVFITQGGLQSTDEAIDAAVPLVGIPIVGDQRYNVEKYVYHKIGVHLELRSLTEEKFRNAIIEVAENESYRKNIKQLRKLMQDQPQTPLERTIWWIEYVIRHKGAKHLRAPAANMSWAEFLELELVLYVTLALVTLLGLCVMTLKCLIENYILKRNIRKEKFKTK